MEDKERAHHNVYFQEELESMKTNVARLSLTRANTGK
jgi:hypothetical protein